MSDEQLIHTVRCTHEEVWTKRRFDLIPEIFTEDFVCHFPGRPDLQGHAGIQEAAEFIKSVFSDWTEVVHEILVSGSHGSSRWTSEGTHDGRAFMGIERSGRRVAVPEMGFYRFSDGRIAEQWNTVDHLIMYWDLGGQAIPRWR